MLDNHSTTVLLGLKGIEVDSVRETKYCLEIHISTPVKEHSCPCCKASTKRVHDYRNQRIKDLRIRGKPVILILRKRRYICKACGKKFYDKPAFLPKYHRMTQRVYESIIDSMRSSYSMKSTAANFNVSTNTVSRVFDIVEYSLHKLPQVVSFDEFKGNAGGQKFQAILTNPERKEVLDILQTREQTYLIDYIKGFSNRHNVKFAIMDMWRPYYEVAKAFFPNATIIIDKYHYVRQLYWALDRVRKRVQQNLTKDRRIYFKRSKKLLFAKYDKLSDENKQALAVMLNTNEDLRSAWELKELFSVFRKCVNSADGRKVLSNWIMSAQDSRLSEFKECTTAYSNWLPEICNSLDYPYTNGFTEGINNKIKVLKRNAYGFRNFKRFRNRILHCCA